MNIKIIDKQNRSLLNEGRNNGMGFAFLKKVNDKTFETVQPISPCKDYLNEVVFTEKYNIPTKGCGLKYLQKKNIFKRVGYLVISILKTKTLSYNYSNSYETDCEKINTNYENIQLFLNKIENLINIKTKTKLRKTKDNEILVSMSYKWCESTIAISLYSFLLRIGLLYDGEKDPIKFIKEFDYNKGDKSLVEQILPKLNIIIKKKQLPKNRFDYSRKHLEKFLMSPHNNGIFHWDEEFEEIELGD